MSADVLKHMTWHYIHLFFQDISYTIYDEIDYIFRKFNDDTLISFMILVVYFWPQAPKLWSLKNVILIQDCLQNFTWDGPGGNFLNVALFNDLMFISFLFKKFEFPTQKLVLTKVIKIQILWLPNKLA